MSNLLLLGAGGPVAVGGGPTLLIHDEFTDTNGTGLASHTIGPTNTPGTGWTVHTGTWTINSNRVGASGGGGLLATCNPGDADVTVQAVCNMSAGGYVGVVGRFTNTSNNWLVGIDSVTDTAIIREVNGGTTTQRASGSVAINSLADYTVKGVFSGTTIHAYVDGASLASYGSATHNQTATRFGLRQISDGDRFDEFKVWDQ